MNIHKITRYLLMLCTFTFLTLTAKGQDGEPLRLAVAGVSHGHLWEVISRLDRGDFKIVGVAEKDDYLREHNGLRDKLDPNLFYADLGEMLDKTHPEAVIVYEPIYDHLRVVEACAPRGIHVMVEKPLAVNNEHATRMASLAREKNILLLTNYETTWYNTNHEAFRLIDSGAIGKIEYQRIRRASRSLRDQLRKRVHGLVNRPRAEWRRGGYRFWMLRSQLSHPSHER